MVGSSNQVLRGKVGIRDTREMRSIGMLCETGCFLPKETLRMEVRIGMKTDLWTTAAFRF